MLLLWEGSDGEEKPHIRISDHSPTLLINATDSCGVKTRLKRLHTSQKSGLEKGTLYITKNERESLIFC
jgi:hypothetical protein